MRWEWGVPLLPSQSDRDSTWLHAELPVLYWSISRCVLVNCGIIYFHQIFSFRRHHPILCDDSLWSTIRVDCRDWRWWIQNSVRHVATVISTMASSLPLMPAVIMLMLVKPFICILTVWLLTKVEGPLRRVQRLGRRWIWNQSPRRGNTRGTVAILVGLPRTPKG